MNKSIHCDQCNVVTINGVLCHETGCPNAWKSERRSCAECGTDFFPFTRFQTVCNTCLDNDLRSLIETDEFFEQIG